MFHIFFSYRADFPTQQKQIACKYYERKKLRIFDDYLSIICSNLTKKFFLVQAICHLLVTTEISYELLRIFTHAKECFFSNNSHIYKYTVIHPQKKHEKKKLNYVILNANFQCNILKYGFWVFSSIWQMNRALKNKRNFLLKEKNNGLSTGMFGRVDFAGAKFNTQPETECFVCDVCFARALLFNLGCSAIYRSSCITNHRNAQQPLQRRFNSLRYLLLKFLYTNTHTLAWHTESLKLRNTMTFSYIDNSQSATNHRSVAPWKHISDLSWYN